MRNIFDTDKALIDVRSAMFVESYHSPQFLRKMSKSRKHLHSRDRIRAVYLAMKKHSLNQIIKFLDRLSGSFKKWIKTYNSQGLGDLLEKKKNIRKTKLSQRRVHC